MRSLLISLFSILLFGPIAAAQTTGALQGTVTDQQDLLVAGATVKLVQSATGTSQTTETGTAGSYVFQFLPPGMYAVTVSHTGFKTITVPNVVVEAATTASVNVRLQVGQVSESVEVTATVQGVNTVDSQVATNVSQVYLNDLPSYTRNVLTYAALQPGVEIDTTQPAGGSQNLNILGTAATVNGNRAQRNDFYLDGMDSKNYRNEALQMPNPDVVQEVQVTTSNTSAEYGRQVGGVFNVVTKSGTNSFHGTAFYFFRLSELNAAPWSSTPLTSPLAQNQKTVGGTVGGPIIKKKTFFYFSYDRFQDSSGRTYLKNFVPTPAMVGGDFSALLAAGPNQRIILDPVTHTACGARVCDNIILPGVQDPVGHSLAALLPTTSAYGAQVNFSFIEPAYNRTLYTKIDHHWNDAHTSTFTWMRSSGNSIYPGLDGANFGWQVMPAWGPQTNVSEQNLYNGRHTWIIRPTLVADFRVGSVAHVANRDNFAFENAFPSATGDAMTTLGATNTTTPQQGSRTYLPSIGIGNAGGGFNSNGLYGHEGWLGIFEQPSFHFGGTLSWTKSKHTFKFGGDAIRVSQRYGVSGEGQTQVGTFTGRFSSNGANTSDVAFGLADLLLGLPDSSNSANGTGGFYQAGLLDYWIHNWNVFYFAQDDWKITPRLTLSPGLRYEFYLPPYVNRNHASEYFTNNPIHGDISTYQSTLFPNAPPGLAFAGDPGVPGGFYHTQRNLIAPRIGIAWDMKGDGKTAIRGGFGKFFGSTALQTKDWPSEQPPWKPAAECVGNTILSNPWLGCQSPAFTQAPTPFTSASAQSFAWPSVFPKYYGFDPNYKTAYNYQWNLSAERQLTNAISLQLGYIGNVGRNLTAIQDINWANFGPGATSDGGNIQSRRPNQRFTGIFLATSAAKSSYNAFQAVGNIRMKGGLQGRLTYVYQHGYLDCDFDPVNNNGNCYANPQNIPGERGENVFHQSFKFFYVWNIPFMKNSNNWGGKILGGWQLTGNGAFYSGTPQNVTLGNDWNVDGIGGDRPDQTGPIQYLSSTNGLGPYVSAGAFTAPGDGTNHNVFGNLRRNAVFGPGRWNVDAAMLKNFHLTESKYFQFRFEAYNLFNHPILGNPDLSFSVNDSGVMTNTGFGTITSKSGNRLTQFGLKFYF